MAFPQERTKAAWVAAVVGNYRELRDLVVRFAPHRAGQADVFMDKQDWRSLVALFDDVWWKAPDAPWIRQLPGWLLLCDLCSEKDVLFDG